MSRLVELRRHTDNDGDVLTGKGVVAALRIGAGLAGGYRLGVSTGAQRATQTLACLLAALGQPGHCCIEPECGAEAQQSGDSPSWKSSKKGSNHSTMPMILSS